jgi:4-hydroxy-3-methylbut-2-enyl diphosphate reductase
VNKSCHKIISSSLIQHYNFHEKKEITTTNFLPSENPVKILLTSGASCPDALVEGVIEKIISFYPARVTVQAMAENFTN